MSLLPACALWDVLTTDGRISAEAQRFVNPLENTELLARIDEMTNDWTYAGAGDVMAYAEVEAYVLTVNGTNYVIDVEHNRLYETAALADGTLVATVTNAAVFADFFPPFRAIRSFARSTFSATFSPICFAVFM